MVHDFWSGMVRKYLIFHGNSTKSTFKLQSMSEVNTTNMDKWFDVETFFLRSFRPSTIFGFTWFISFECIPAVLDFCIGVSTKFLLFINIIFFPWMNSSVFVSKKQSEMEEYRFVSVVNRDQIFIWFNYFDLFSFIQMHKISYMMDIWLTVKVWAFCVTDEHLGMVKNKKKTTTKTKPTNERLIFMIIVYCTHT